jgi:hypothetical protein
MDAIKAFFRTAWMHIKENLGGVLNMFPWTAGFIFVCGTGFALLLLWLLN